MNLHTLLQREWRELVGTLRPSVPQTAPDEGALIQRAAEASPAKQFVESPVVQEFMARAEANLTHQLLGLPLDEDDGRRNLAVAVQTVRQLKHYLVALAQDGAAAERELERLRSGASRKEFF